MYSFEIWNSIAIPLDSLPENLREPLQSEDVTRVPLMEASRAQPGKARLGPKVLFDSQSLLNLYVRSK